MRILALSLTLFLAIYSHSMGLTSAFAEDGAAAIVSAGEVGVKDPALTPQRLSSLEAARDAANSSPWVVMEKGKEAFSPKHGEVRIAGACPGSSYTCGARYPYCCYSENKGYYCRKDAKHC